MNLISAAFGFRFLSYAGVAALLVVDSSITLWGVLVTAIASLIAQILTASEARKRADQQHRFDAEDRAAGRAATESARDAIRSDIAQNTTLTRKASDRADAAYEVANNVNEKIAGIAAAALNQDRVTASAALTLDRATAKSDTDSIRHDIADLKGHE